MLITPACIWIKYLHFSLSDITENRPCTVTKYIFFSHLCRCHHVETFPLSCNPLYSYIIFISITGGNPSRYNRASQSTARRPASSMSPLVSLPMWFLHQPISTLKLTLHHPRNRSHSLWRQLLIACSLKLGKGSLKGGRLQCKGCLCHGLLHLWIYKKKHKYSAVVNK